MPIPTYEQMLRPILAIAATRDITRRDVTGTITRHGDCSVAAIDFLIRFNPSTAARHHARPPEVASNAALAGRVQGDTCPIV